MHLHKFLRTVILFFLSLLSVSSFAQGLILRNMDEEARLVDRYEIMSGELSKYFYGTHKNVSARGALQLINNVDDNLLTKTDEANITKINGTNFSALANIKATAVSKKSLLKTFYTSPNNFFSYASAEGSFAVNINPIINYTQLVETKNTDQLFVNQKGVDLSATILNKVHIYTLLMDNQERNPAYNSAFIANTYAIPGAGYYKGFKTDTKKNGWDYSLAKGYVSMDIIPNVINATFGHDKFFLGDGYRSLFLSENSNNMLFLKTNWHFWKIYYQTTLMELTKVYTPGADRKLPTKYAAMHHLGLQLNKKLNVGVFEAVVFGRNDHFDFQYLNPLIFYRTIEQQLGSPDNANLGLDAKYLPIKNVELYGQLMLDEFRFGDVFSGDKHWANKQAYQLGAKYINAFGISNLDIQLEHNNIRPYTYSYKDSVAEYSHYNQALAHPNGANLREEIVAIYYQPKANLRMSLETIYRKQGTDSSLTDNAGGNIFKDYDFHGSLVGHENLSGVLQTSFFTNLNVTYTLLRNLNIDAGLIYRNTKLGVNTPVASSSLYIGARLNAQRRKYNY